MYYYVAAEYFATGEGKSVFLLITNATSDKNEALPKFASDGNGSIHINGKLHSTKEEIAIKNFQEKIGVFLP